MNILPSCIYVYHVYAWYLRRPEEEVRPLENGFAYGCELLCSFWQLNPGLLQDQGMF